MRIKFPLGSENKFPEIPYIGIKRKKQERCVLENPVKHLGYGIGHHVNHEDHYHREPAVGTQRRQHNAERTQEQRYHDGKIMAASRILRETENSPEKMILARISSSPGTRVKASK